MSTRRWLDTVLRARQAQEDVAAQTLAAAHRDAREAIEWHEAETERVESMTAPDHSTRQAFQAAAAARHAAAATLAAAAHRVEFAETRVAADAHELAEAARARRTVEKLDERETAARNSALGQAAQRDLDEIATTRHAAAKKAASS